MKWIIRFRHDDAIRAVKLITSKMADAVLEGKQGEQMEEEAEEAAEVLTEAEAEVAAAEEIAEEIAQEILRRLAGSRSSRRRK